ncbi:MAG TPA: DUF4926 domain-containing protein [Actinoplanes sp.]|nr:DUF4926 domain-containing protein [Actinoplanes sp.]
MVQELDVVALVIDLPDQELKAGAEGTVVHVFHRPRLAYEVEFVDRDGATVAMVTLTPEQVRRVDRRGHLP